ncbi:hypothetical protein BDP27DRAFT_1417368 [Rhodocollybia butyracea]|uniref:Uncharacterized protein n=1 Tax=Rhodocollybia butyracea TaxID=206335 RepID=A0A9P5PVI1_9AGAR|nr:hypothetical protein BDP27DRAFT_1417368 [Rhodocollybia butyracea]
MEGNWQKSLFAKPTLPMSLDDVLGALRHAAGANGNYSIFVRKAVEIYDASEARGVQGYKEALKQLASVACNLVYAILRAPQEISSQDGTLNHVENLLDRALHAIRTIPGSYLGSSSTSTVYRSLLRRKDPSTSKAQLQLYTDQLCHMLFHFQAWLSLSQRVSVLEGRTCLEGKKHGTLPGANSSSVSFSPSKFNPFISSASGTSGTTIQRGSPDSRILGLADQIGHVRSDPLAPTPSNHVRRNSNNPFLPAIESGGFPRDTTLQVASFVPPVATDISLRASHVGGSSSTASQVDNSTKENCNNVTNNVTHNVTANFNGNIFMPAFPALRCYPSPGPVGGAYTSGYNVHGGNGGYTNRNGGAHNENGGWIPISVSGYNEFSTNDGLNNYRGYYQ